MTTFFLQCQTEEQQRGVHQPRDQMASAVPKERPEQVSRKPALQKGDVCVAVRTKLIYMPVTDNH